jgi:predicted metal-dependent HD superfamily phosphohydrolase
MNLKTSDSIYNNARNLYSNKLHYHNFDHVIDTLNNAKNIIKKCDDKNIIYDEKIISHAILFHDAAYDVDSIKKGFKSKESYSAFLAANILSEQDESENHIKQVINAILCTKIDAKCRSNNEKIVRAADLLGLASPYPEFKKKSVDLYKEREFLSGEKITWTQYKKETFNIIRKFLEPRIELDIEMFSSANYMFHTRVFQNLDKLMKDTID